jgi:hypothetical protein
MKALFELNHPSIDTHTPRADCNPTRAFGRCNTF